MVWVNVLEGVCVWFFFDEIWVVIDFKNEVDYSYFIFSSFEWLVLDLKKMIFSIKLFLQVFDSLIFKQICSSFFLEKGIYCLVFEFKCKVNL